MAAQSFLRLCGSNVEQRVDSLAANVAVAVLQRHGSPNASRCAEWPSVLANAPGTSAAGASINPRASAAYPATSSAGSSRHLTNSGRACLARLPMSASASAAPARTPASLCPRASMSGRRRCACRPRHAKGSHKAKPSDAATDDFTIYIRALTAEEVTAHRGGK